MKYIKYTVLIAVVAAQIWLFFEIQQLHKDMRTVGAIMHGAGIIETVEDDQIRIFKMLRE